MANYLRLIHEQLASQGLIPNEMLKINVEQAEPDASETVIVSDDNIQFIPSNQPSSHSLEDTGERQEVNRNVEEELIELVRDYRCIWDTSCRSFKEHPKKQQAWRNISGKLNLDGMWFRNLVSLEIYDHVANSVGGLSNAIEIDGFLLH